MHKSNRWSLILGLIIIGTFISSCNKEEEFIGAELVAAGTDFEVISPLVISNYEPDFQSDEVVSLQAQVNQEVSTTVTYTGLSSGAVYELEFRTSLLSAENTTWAGGNTGTQWFRRGEQVAIRVTFFGSTIELLDTVTIDRPIDFSDDENVYIVPSSSFEGTLDWADNQWWVGVSGGVNATIGSQTIPFVNPISPGDSIVTTVSGDKAMVFKGIKSAGSSYMGGASQGVRDGIFVPNLPEDPDQVWVNVYSYGLGTETSHTNLQMLFGEADGDNTQNRSGRDDEFIFQIPTDHEGWKLISKRYSSLSASTYCVEGVEGGGCGNKIHEPHKIDLVSLNFETETEGLTAAGIIDYMIITIGEPFDPAKY